MKIPHLPIPPAQQTLRLSRPRRKKDILESTKPPPTHPKKPAPGSRDTKPHSRTQSTKKGNPLPKARENPSGWTHRTCDTTYLPAYLPSVRPSRMDFASINESSTSSRVDPAGTRQVTQGGRSFPLFSSLFFFSFFLFFFFSPPAPRACDEATVAAAAAVAVAKFQPPLHPPPGRFPRSLAPKYLRQMKERKEEKKRKRKSRKERQRRHTHTHTHPGTGWLGAPWARAGRSAARARARARARGGRGGRGRGRGNSSRMAPRRKRSRWRGLFLFFFFNFLIFLFLLASRSCVGGGHGLLH